jgi:hypothetical protein
MAFFGKRKKTRSKKSRSKKAIPMKIRRLCKKLKIKLSKRTKSGRRVYKSLRQLKKEIRTKKRNLKRPSLFIQKANKISKKKGTVGSFGRWCKSQGLTKNGKVTLRCINKAMKSGNTKLIRRANFAKNIRAFTR